ncbi:hypothetical protein LDDCCGHA_5782 [Methylobacterium oxalidis]|nr:hypothetical protein LDDCCGHA_5782 [Methylobacterium oxalidis]
MAQREPVSCSRALSGFQVSCVPQPSSAGWLPSETKPSTDHVFTNTPIGFSDLARWVSRSAMWMPLTPRSFISAAHSSRLFGSGRDRPVSAAMLRSACLTNHETMPGLAPQQETAVGPPGLASRASRMRFRSA